MNESALIVGAGSGLSASLAQLCASRGMKVVLAARNIEKLKNLKKEIGADTIKCDATNIKSVKNLFNKTDKIIGAPNLVIYNPSKSLGGSAEEALYSCMVYAILANRENTNPNTLQRLLIEKIDKLERSKSRLIFTNFTD